MLDEIRRPDPLLRLALYLFRVVLNSPLGEGVLDLGRKILAQDDSNWLEINRIRLCLPRLAQSFSGYRIAQISDFHIGTWADREKLLEAVKKVNPLEPDMVAITGDFVTFDPERYADDLVYILRQLNPKDGCVAILGNHDHWTDASSVRKMLRRANILELRNTVKTIYRGNEPLHVAGIDDVMIEADDLPAVLKQIPPEGAAILLAHEPDFADISAASRRFDLQLSGHTHGGQVQLPRFGPIVLPRYGRKYPCGLYKIQDMYLYTNRGLGTAELEIRFRCPAEITLFELSPQYPILDNPDSF